MKNSRYLLWLGVATAAGTAAGMLADRREPARGGLLGGAAGMIAASVVTGFRECVSSRKSVPFYSSSSPLYDDTDAA